MLITLPSIFVTAAFGVAQVNQGASIALPSTSVSAYADTPSFGQIGTTTPTVSTFAARQSVAAQPPIYVPGGA